MNEKTIRDLHKSKVLTDIAIERKRQEELHNIDSENTLSLWMTILTGRMGKLSEEVLRVGYIHHRTPDQVCAIWDGEFYVGSGRFDMYDRAVQVAAVAAAMAEQLSIAGLRSD